MRRRPHPRLQIPSWLLSALDKNIEIARTATAVWRGNSEEQRQGSAGVALVSGYNRKARHGAVVTIWVKDI